MTLSGNLSVSETDLINGCIAGNHRMQEKLYTTYAPKMFGVCLRYAGNTEDAQDILQDGFVKVFNNLNRYRREGSFEGWMRRIFVNTAIESYRKKIYFEPVGEAQETQLEDTQMTTLDTLAVKDLVSIIQELSPGYRSVFNLYAIEGFTHREIGEMLGISEGTSKSQLARAKAILQDKIKSKYAFQLK